MVVNPDSILPIIYYLIESSARKDREKNLKAVSIVTQIFLQADTKKLEVKKRRYRRKEARGE